MQQRKWVRILAVLFAVVLLAGQFLPDYSVDAAKRKRLNVKKLTLIAGKSKKLKVSGIKANKVKWTSSKKSVASVSKKGKVKAKKAGKTVITASFAGGRLKCKVTVKKRKAGTRPVSTKKPAAATTPKPVQTQPPVKKPSSQKSNVLVAYFSWSGTSERIANNIIEQTKADSFRIERAVPYSSDYQTTAYGDAKTEADTNARPAIKAPLTSVAQYDKIILCYPIWWHTAPMTVGTFLEHYDFTGKNIYPVSQSGSMDKSQYDQSVSFIKSCAKGAVVDAGIFSTDDLEIRNYINQIIRE